MAANTQQAHPPITNNDDWLAAVTDWTSTALSKYMTGQRLTPWEIRFIDTMRAQVGAPPESPKHYMDRVSREPEAYACD